MQAGKGGTGRLGRICWRERLEKASYQRISSLLAQNKQLPGNRN